MRHACMSIAIGLLVLLASGCGDDDGSGPAQPGTITARADGIQNQNGKAYQVDAFDYEWTPGAEGAAIARIRTVIPSDGWSSTAVLNTIAPSGDPTTEAKVFGPGVYSVVFFVAPPGGDPDYYVGLRTTVNGNVTATAPAWGSW